MSNGHSGSPSFSQRNSTSLSPKSEADAGTANLTLGFRKDDEGFELPARLFEQLPFAVYVCDRDGLLLRYNQRAAELWGRSPKLREWDERYCGSHRMYRPDGSRLAHSQCPMAEVLRTGISVRQQEVHIERPDGSRGIALVDIEAVKDSAGNIVGAINCFQDITERKRSDDHIVNLAREAEHRTRNILATVLATVRLSNSHTPGELKQLIEGRINALSKVHALFVESRWAGAELHRLATQELLAYRGEKDARVQIDGPAVMLEPSMAQIIAISLHELATNAAKYGSLSEPGGRIDILWSHSTAGGLGLRWIESGGPPATPPTHCGFGTRVVKNMIEHLGGKVRFDWRGQGLTCEIAVPLAQAGAPAIGQD